MSGKPDLEKIFADDGEVEKVNIKSSKDLARVLTELHALIRENTIQINALREKTGG